MGVSLLVVAAIAAAGSAMYSAKQQQKIADAEIEQGELDKRASIHASEQNEKVEGDNIARDLTNVRRELLRSASTATAIQADKGIAGVSATRSKRNINVQTNFNEQYIKAQGDNVLQGVRNAGLANTANFQRGINSSTSRRVSNTGILVRGAIAGASTYASGKSGGKK